MRRHKPADPANRVHVVPLLAHLDSSMGCIQTPANKGRPVFAALALFDSGDEVTVETGVREYDFRSSRAILLPNPSPGLDRS